MDLCTLQNVDLLPEHKDLQVLRCRGTPSDGKQIEQDAQDVRQHREEHSTSPPKTARLRSKLPTLCTLPHGLNVGRRCPSTRGGRRFRTKRGERPAGSTAAVR